MDQWSPRGGIENVVLDLDAVKYEVVEDHSAVVRLDNPPVNAHSAQLLTGIPLTFDRLSELDHVRAAVLTGAGKVFCAGADVKAGGGAGPEPGDFLQGSRAASEAYHSIRECRKPVVGAINGAALGGGLAIMASCDIVVASEQASVGLPEIDVGLLGAADTLVVLGSVGDHARELATRCRCWRVSATP